MTFIYLNREAYQRATTQRRRTSRKTGLVSIADIAWVEEMITELHREIQSATLAR